MEQVTIGKLAFDQRVDADNEELVTVRRSGMDESGPYAVYTRCNDDQREWNYLKKNCWPMNGVGPKPPVGKWVLLEYTGRDRSSANLMPETRANGFTERELMRLTATVNAIFGDDDRPAIQLEGKVRKRRKKTKEVES